MERDKQIAQYLAMGFELIPLRGGKDPDRSKEPIDGITWADEVKYNRKVMTGQETADLLKSMPGSNIGIICGKRSKGLVVVDLETKDQGIIKRTLTNLGLPENTATVETFRGYHFYYLTGQAVVFQNLEGPNGEHAGEIRPDGHCIVAPPSIHASGHIYAFLPGKDLSAIKSATFPGPDTISQSGGRSKVINLPSGPPGPGLSTEEKTRIDRARKEGQEVKNPGRKGQKENKSWGKNRAKVNALKKKPLLKKYNQGAGSDTKGRGK